MEKIVFLFISIFIATASFGSADPSCLRNKFWASEAISGNLMVETIDVWRRSHPQIGKTNIAIVDSGIRKTHLSELNS